MLLDLKFSIGTLGIGSGAFIAGLYGMNLKNFIEESNLGFVGISSLSFAFAALICVFGLEKLRRVQRVRMYGEGGRTISESRKNMDLMAAVEGRAENYGRLGGDVEVGNGSVGEKEDLASSVARDLSAQEPCK